MLTLAQCKLLVPLLLNPLQIQNRLHNCFMCGNEGCCEYTGSCCTDFDIAITCLSMEGVSLPLEWASGLVRQLALPQMQQPAPRLRTCSMCMSCGVHKRTQRCMYRCYNNTSTSGTKSCSLPTDLRAQGVAAKLFVVITSAPASINCLCKL